MTVVLVLGLAMNAVALPLAARRVLFLYRVITSGQPAPDRIAGVTGRAGAALKRQVVEVFGQKKLLMWSVPGAAHFFVFWAFLILATVYLEAYGSLLKLLFGGDQLDWAIPVIGHWAVLGFLQDFIAMMAFFGIATFVWIRLKNAPKDLGRRSRFFGSHLSGAWITLFMIFNVIWTMFLFRGASSSVGNLPYQHGAFVSIGVGNLLGALPHGGREFLEGIGLLLHIGVMLVFLIFVLNSKHLHIFVAPLNVLFGRQPVALGAAKPMMNAGKPLTLDDLEDLDEDAKLGVGAAEDFSWKGILDFTTCTECGRCQDQCPAWNTEKPLSPKLMIMALRDHTLAKAPYLLAEEGKREALVGADASLAREVERPLVGDTGDDWFYLPDSGASVIDPDVLWSCVTCGACVQQCPVDIEHVDHILDMRRYQVLVESNFPAELNQLFKGLEGKGNPWNMSPSARLDWTNGLDFDVPVVGEDLESLESVDWLFWVGCAGAYEDRAKKTTRAVAELLNLAGVSFGVLGQGETCTGDAARRAGNEFVFQGLAQQNVETFKEFKVKKVVSTCAHCFNTLKNEYRDFGIELEVVHHTQLLNRLVREGKLTPVNDGAGAAKRSITYHDPCYLGRHNQVYAPPRELLQVLPGAEFVEMERNSERSFCCGAGGARMWMEETIGSRINENRTAEAVATGADQIAVGCPFCRVMLSDGLTSKQASGEAREEVEVLDVAQMLLAAVKGESATKLRPTGAPAARSEETRAEPEAGDETQTEETVTRTEDVGPATAASAGSSLFDVDDESSDTDTNESEPSRETWQDGAASTAKPASGGSLFDLGSHDTTDDSDASAGSKPKPKPEPAVQGESPSASTTSPDHGSGGSLFDLGTPSDEPAADEFSDQPEPDAKPEPKAKTDPETATLTGAAVSPVQESPVQESPVQESPVQETPGQETPGQEIPEGGSLFDLAPPEAPPAPAPAADPEREPVPEAEETRRAEPAPMDKDVAGDATPEPAPAAAAVAATSAAEIPEGGSLFDLEAPALTAPEPEPGQPGDEAAIEMPAEPEPVRPAEETADEPSSTSDRPSGADLSRLATAAASDQDEPVEADETTAEPSAFEPRPRGGPSDDGPRSDTARAETETEPGTETGTETGATATGTASGHGHAPRTDVDITESDSLFDL